MNYADVMHRFAARHALKGLTEKTIKQLYDGAVSIDKAHRFIDFSTRLENELPQHAVIAANPYARWFSATTLDDRAVKHFLVQFSIVSNQFLLAQLHKTINAPDLEQMRRDKEILVNELGVDYRRERPARAANPAGDSDGIPPPAPPHSAGGIEGGVFHFDAAHFERLVQAATPLGLGFEELGRRIYGTPSTLFFCDELIRLYSSDDRTVSQAGAYALRTWAASGFWRQLEQGLAKYKTRKCIGVPLTFFSHHAALEDALIRRAKNELEHDYFTRHIDEDLFVDKVNEMLDGIFTFWKGLDDDRKRSH